MFPWQLDVTMTLGSASVACWPPEQQQQQEDEGLAVQLVQLRPALCEYAAHVAAGSLDGAIRCLERILGLASLCDGPLQRLSKIMVDGLVRRLLGSTINRALIHPYCQRSVRTARYNFIKLLPFLRMAYVAINRVILDDMEKEKFVHIIDLSGPAAHPWQWLKLMRAFRRRPEGPPADLRITMVHDDEAFLADTSARLRKEAEALDMAFSFHGFLGRLETMDMGNLHAALEIKSGYARAFSCALQMHRLLPLETMIKMNNLPSDPSPTTPLSPFAAATPSPQQHLVPPSLTRFQLAVRALSPKVLVVVEQEANCNVPDFTARFQEALHYYAALFDALHDDTGGGMQEERAKVEQIVLGEEIKDMLVRDVVAEPLQQWTARMVSAGFEAVPLSYVAKKEADEVLKKCRVSEYENRKHGDCLLLCRSDRPLYAVSAWRPWSSSQGSPSVSNQQHHMVVPLPGQIPSTWTWPQQQAAPAHNFTC